MSQKGGLVPPSKSFIFEETPSPKKQAQNEQAATTTGASISNVNQSPSKQAFTTIKNFLKSKSSLTDLTSQIMGKDREKDEYTPFPDEDYNDNVLHEVESTVSFKAEEIKPKVPKKKKSLSSLLPNKKERDKHRTNSKFENQLLDIKLMTAPPFIANNTNNVSNSSSPITPTRKSLSSTHKHTLSASSLTNYKPLSASSSNKSDIKPQQAATDVNPKHAINSSNYSKHPSTPTLASSNYTTDSNLFSSEWITPTTIRGTYLHDWSNNMSPRSLAESIKVGKVTTGYEINSHDTLKVETTFMANAENNSEDHDLDSSINLTPTCKTGMGMEPFLDNSILMSKSNSSTDSLNSHLSKESQFSFLKNRTSSIRFYKSTEQVELEESINEEKNNRLKFNDFLGTDNLNEYRNHFMDFDSIKNGSCNDVLDDDINFNNFDEDDETDELFNRDIFGLNEDNETPKRKGLSLEIDDDETPRNGLPLEIEEQTPTKGNTTHIDEDATPTQETEPTPPQEGSSAYSTRPRNDVPHKESSMEILNMLNGNLPVFAPKPETTITVKHTPSVKLNRHSSIKYHQLSSKYEACEDDEYDEYDEYELIDEINQVPENYEDMYDADMEETSTAFINTSNNYRFSTIVSSGDSKLINVGKNEQNQHLWKNLTHSNYSKVAIHPSRPQSERIILSNKTVTLYGGPNYMEMPNDDLLDEDDKQETEKENKDHRQNEDTSSTGLCTILE